jgi:hypothetical protein
MLRCERRRLGALCITDENMQGTFFKPNEISTDSMFRTVPNKIWRKASITLTVSRLEIFNWMALELNKK